MVIKFENGIKVILNVTLMVHHIIAMVNIESSQSNSGHHRKSQKSAHTQKKTNLQNPPQMRKKS
jgi:hypothetical protein